MRDSQLDTLALVVVGVTQSLSAQLGKIARAMPVDTTQYAKEQRLRWFLDNQRVTQADHYQPLHVSFAPARTVNAEDERRAQ